MGPLFFPSVHPSNPQIFISPTSYSNFLSLSTLSLLSFPFSLFCSFLVSLNPPIYLSLLNLPTCPTFLVYTMSFPIPLLFSLSLSFPLFFSSLLPTLPLLSLSHSPSSLSLTFPLFLSFLIEFCSFLLFSFLFRSSSSLGVCQLTILLFSFCPLFIHYLKKSLNKPSIL